MLVCQVCHLTAAGSTLKESLLDKERLIYILYGTGILTKCGCNGTQAYRTTLELVNDGGKDAVVNLIQSVFVYVERLKGYIGY